MTAHHVPSLPWCGLCGYHNANTNHVLFFCQEIKKAWNYTKWWYQIKEAKRINTVNLAIHLSLVLPSAELEQVATKMWGIWRERCNLLHTNNGAQPRTSIQAKWTESFLQHYHNEKLKLTDGTTHDNSMGQPISQRCRENYIIKVDAAFNESEDSYATGFFIVDKNQKPLAAGGRKISHPGSILAAEITAIMDGVGFWNSYLKEPIYVLSDSKEAIEAVNSDYQYKSYEETLIMEARDLINSSPVKGIFYCQRQHNMEAHNLAKIASKSLLPQAWVGRDIPRQIMSIAQDLH